MPKPAGHSRYQRSRDTINYNGAGMQTLSPQIDSQPRRVSATRSAGRLEFIDAIRGIAAVLVMVEHYSERWFTQAFLPVTDYVNLGRIGVITFFVVSGFVIPMSIERKNNLKEFWISRFCRLYPAYWTALILFVLLSILESRYGDRQNWQLLSAYGPRVWLPNIFIAQMFFRVPDVILVSWTLGLEWVIYITASLLHARKWLNQWLGIFIATALLDVAVGIAFPIFTHHRVPFAAVAALTSGAAGLALYREWNGQIANKKAWLTIAAYIVLLLVGAQINYGLYPTRSESNFYIKPISEMTSTFLGFALFLVPMMMKDVQFPKLILWLGRISYSIYILHDVVPIPRFLGGVSGFAFQLVETLILSYLCYRFIELPGIEFGKRLIRTMRPA